MPRDLLLDVVRIFSRGSWYAGGRYYAPFQNIPSDIRLHLTIDGKSMVSLDYSSLHPRLLYNEVGIVMPHDPYCIEEYDRKIAKVATNIAINAQSRDSAIKAIARRCFSKPRGGEHANRDELAQAERLMDSILDFHDPIRGAFGSDAGVRLQHVDAQAMRTVTKKCQAAGIQMLPVHDEALVEERHASTVQGFMIDALAQCTKGPNRATVGLKRSGGIQGQEEEQEDAHLFLM